MSGTPACPFLAGLSGGVEVRLLDLAFRFGASGLGIRVCGLEFYGLWLGVVISTCPTDLITITHVAFTGTSTMLRAAATSMTLPQGHVR